MRDVHQTAAVTRYGPGAICRLGVDILAAAGSSAAARDVARGACATILLGTISYGFVFGLWRAPLQAVYSAVKLPLLFFSVALASAGINTMLAQLLGARLSFRQTAAAMLLGMATSAAILAALSPVALFLVLQAPAPGHDAGADRTYWALLLTHVAVIGAAGIVGNVRLYRLLLLLTGRRRLAAWVLALWLAVAGFVGCELSWLLSPFLCKPTQAPHFIAREYAEGNFYERVWHAVNELAERRTIRQSMGGGSHENAI